MEQFDREGKLALRIVVTNTPSQAPISEWIPSNWTSSAFRGNRLFQQVEVRTTSRELNITTTEDDFQIDLPSGTRVRDVSGSEKRDYITRDEGKKRDILPSELGASYDQLVQTETGDLAGSHSRRWQWFLVALGAAVAIGVLGTLIWHRRRRESVPESP
jgi:hypothetical protein